MPDTENVRISAELDSAITRNMTARLHSPRGASRAYFDGAETALRLLRRELLGNERTADEQTTDAEETL